MTDAAANHGAPTAVTIEILPVAAIDEMVGKVRAAAAADGAAEAVERWRVEHRGDLASFDGHDHAVVGATLMYLDDAPDGMLVPHVLYPDGSEKIYTDAEHADGLSGAS